MADIALQRKNMVESQVRPSDVTDRRITGAMQDIAREKFVPASLADLAYMDDPLAVSPGRSLMAPRTFARLLQLADVLSTDSVLIVGSLSGYSTFVASRLAKTVVALESDGALSAEARSALASAGVANAVVVSGALNSGWPAAAPFDVILVEGGFEAPPTLLLDQLSATGRLVGIDNADGVGRAVVMQTVGSKTRASATRRVAFEASSATLPGFERSKSFAF